MNNTFHIVNNKKAYEVLVDFFSDDIIIFPKDIFFWRLTNEKINTDDYWKERYYFFETTFTIDKITYFDAVIKELAKIQELPQNATLFLWISESSVEQLNLLAILTYILDFYRKDISYQLISYKHEIQQENLKILLDSKIKITRSNLVFANTCWEILASKDIGKIKNFNFNQTRKFNYLKKSITNFLPIFEGDELLEKHLRDQIVFRFT